MIELLLTACHEPQEFVWKGQKLTLKRGELITSHQALQQTLGVSKKTIESVLNRMVREGEIRKQSSSAGTLVSIVNYDEYQARQEPHQEPDRSEVGSGVGSATGADYEHIRSKEDKKVRSTHSPDPQSENSVLSDFEPELQGRVFECFPNHRGPKRIMNSGHFEHFRRNLPIFKSFAESDWDALKIHSSSRYFPKLSKFLELPLEALDRAHKSQGMERNHGAMGRTELEDINLHESHETEL